MGFATYSLGDLVTLEEVYHFSVSAPHCKMRTTIFASEVCVRATETMNNVT